MSKKVIHAADNGGKLEYKLINSRIFGDEASAG